MTDVPDGSGQIPRRPPRIGEGGAPVSGALAIVLAVVAVVAGFLILRSISDGGNETADFPDPAGGAGVDPDDSLVDPDGSVPGGSAVPTLPTTTTLPPIVTEGASVIVANANGQGGTAGNMTRALRDGAGFDMVDPTDASSATGDIETTVIYFDPAVPAAQTVADSVGRVLGGVSSILPLPDGTPPTSDGSLNGAGVLVMLGIDKANKTLEELAPDLANPADVVTVTNPAVSGSTTPTTTG